MVLIMVLLVTQIAGLQKYIDKPMNEVRKTYPDARQLNCSGQQCDYVVLLDIVKGRRCVAIFKNSGIGYVASIETFGAGCPGDEKTLKRIPLKSLLQMSLAKKLRPEEILLLLGPSNMAVGCCDFGNEEAWYKLDEFPVMGLHPRKVIEQVENSPCGFSVYFRSNTRNDPVIVQEIYPPKNDNCWFYYYPGEFDFLE